ncbi:hypothetical protein [Nonomuraea sp. NPDC001831]|uniref:hypothetical protein n=1 Tax=Nonomuraea sp. NPDC001831 TaxID=3364340 RepID=UPI0036C241CA
MDHGQGAAGEVVGRVADVRLCQDGPLLMGVQNAFRVSGLIVVPRRTGKLFGYERGPGGRAPWLVEALIRRRLKGSRLVAWEQLAWAGGSWSAEPGAGLRLNVPADRLAPPHRAVRARAGTYIAGCTFVCMAGAVAVPTLSS